MVFFSCVCLGGFTLDLKRKKKTARENKGGLISLLNNKQESQTLGMVLTLFGLRKVQKDPSEQQMAVPRWREDKTRLFSPRVTVPSSSKILFARASVSAIS